MCQPCTTSLLSDCNSFLSDNIPWYRHYKGLPWWLSGKESACNADMGLIPRLEDPLQEGMETHSSFLAWRIPWTEGPGGLQCMGSQRVRHNLVIKQQTPYSHEQFSLHQAYFSPHVTTHPTSSSFLFPFPII